MLVLLSDIDMIRTVTLEKLLFYGYSVGDVISRIKKNRHAIFFQHLNNYPKMNLTIKENTSNFLEIKIIKYNVNLTTKGPNYSCVGHLELRNSATEMSCLETFTDQREYQVTLKWSIAFSRMAIHYSFHLICLIKVNYLSLLHNFIQQILQLDSAQIQILLAVVYWRFATARISFIKAFHRSAISQQHFIIINNIRDHFVKKTKLPTTIRELKLNGLSHC